MKILWMNTLGMTILRDVLKEASYLFTGSDSRGRALTDSYKQVCSESLAFVQGTGLEIMMSCYYIAYDGTDLRNNFFTRFNRRDLID